jgi:hypothetical protein
MSPSLICEITVDCWYELAFPLLIAASVPSPPFSVIAPAVCSVPAVSAAAAVVVATTSHLSPAARSAFIGGRKAGILEGKEEGFGRAGGRARPRMKVVFLALSSGSQYANCCPMQAKKDQAED